MAAKKEEATPAAEASSPPEAQASTAVAVVEPHVLAPAKAAEVTAAMKEYQQLLPQLLDESDYQDTGRDGKFVKKSGWRKIAKAFMLSVELRDVTVERDDAGQPTRASAIARALHAPSGQYSDGDGYCSVDERRFAADSGKQKLENDLRATATTRAKNRAISDLVGMGAVSAEEVEATPAAAGPPFGPATPEDTMPKAIAALTMLLTDDASDSDTAPSLTAKVWSQVEEDAGGYLPKIVARAFLRAAVALRESREVETAEAGFSLIAKQTKLLRART